MKSESVLNAIKGLLMKIANVFLQFFSIFSILKQ